MNDFPFQIPSFVCSATPTLAPGGGAEVLPGSLLSDNSLANSWFSNNGFTPRDFAHLTHHHDDGSLLPAHPPLSAPFDLPEHTTTPSVPQPHLSAFHFPSPLPSPFGLPIYSTSGFDLLSILARVAHRPHPRVLLGPVDLTCSFVVVDVRRYDHPIVYCSPSFCRLTGYEEHEILGRNCRFLQAPKGEGEVRRGEVRRFTDQSAVVHLKKNLSADKECQTSIVNYKKDGRAFINLLTVIPVLGGVAGAEGEEAEVVYHVGFQVDLTEQPNAILEKLRDGSYLVDYAQQQQQQRSLYRPETVTMGQGKERKSQVIPSVRMSREMKKLLADPAFVNSIPMTTVVPPPPSSSSSSNADPGSLSHSQQMLNLILLETCPDFIHVVSLKGSFLYVGPSVRRVLGYEPEEMIGKSIADYAHPEDVVPLMRELKEGSATGLSAVSMTDPPSPMTTPRTVDLLFRARTQVGVYVWMESKGRLYVEPGKGRKAIVLSGRAKEMSKLGWACVQGGFGLPMGMKQTEVWGTMTSGQGSGGVLSFLVVGEGVVDVLGWSSQELVGREVGRFLVDGYGKRLDEEVRALRRWEGNPRRLVCKMRHRDGSSVDVVLMLYRPTQDSSATAAIKGIIPAPLIYQLCTLDSFTSSSSMTTTTTTPDGDMFEELDVHRESSWQYEIQQIRFANQRLEEEIAVLGRQLEEAEGVERKMWEELGLQQQHHSASLSMDYAVPSYMTVPGEMAGSSYSGFMPSQGLSLSYGREWDEPVLVQPQPRLASGLKRSWDVAIG